MIKTIMTAGGMTDAELVADSLSGADREAFGQIVARYQSLICSLAYSATGSLSQSEDLAQETFLTAWQQLGELREPPKLRSWLCGIARNLINNWLRRQGHEPSHAAETLDAIEDTQAPGPLPHDHTVNREEEAILWRSLERIPQTYREPLVLFYRERQSIERVAAALELSEDAVKQRLSRGRKLLHEQVLAFVEGALERTNPGKGFTVGVLAALPVLASSATASALTVVAAKGGSTAKTATGLGVLGAVLTAGVLFLFSVIAALLFLGGCIGCKMRRASEQSQRQLAYAGWFWRAIALGFLLLVLPAGLCSSFIHDLPLWAIHGSTWSTGAFYWLVAVALAGWFWLERRAAARPHTAPSPGPASNSHLLWITLGTIGPSSILAMLMLGIFFTDWTLTSQRISESEAERLIAQRKDARFSVSHYQHGPAYLDIKLPENDRVVSSVPFDESIRSMLSKNEIAYRERVEGRDFHRLGKSGRWLPLISAFIVGAGVVQLRRRRT